MMFFHFTRSSVRWQIKFEQKGGRNPVRKENNGIHREGDGEGRDFFR